MGDSDKHVAANVAAGVVGGLAASAAMVGVQWVWSALSGGEQQPETDPQQHKSQPDEEKSATRTLARLGARKIAKRDLTSEQEKSVAGVIHYAFGGAVGGLYGLACSVDDRAGIGQGAPFGAAVWALGDEFALPRLGLTKPATEFPPSKHAYTFTAHLVYGYVTETVRRAIVSAFTAEPASGYSQDPAGRLRAAR